MKILKSSKQQILKNRSESESKIRINAFMGIDELMREFST